KAPLEDTQLLDPLLKDLVEHLAYKSLLMPTSLRPEMIRNLAQILFVEHHKKPHPEFGQRVLVNQDWVCFNEETHVGPLGQYARVAMDRAETNGNIYISLHPDYLDIITAKITLKLLENKLKSEASTAAIEYRVNKFIQDVIKKVREDVIAYFHDENMNHYDHKDGVPVGMASGSSGHYLLSLLNGVTEPLKALQKFILGHDETLDESYLTGDLEEVIRLIKHDNLKHAESVLSSLLTKCRQHAFSLSYEYTWEGEHVIDDLEMALYILKNPSKPHHHSKYSNGPAPTKPPGGVSKKPYILIVDDHLDIVSMILRHLIPKYEASYDFITASDGVDALDQIKK